MIFKLESVENKLIQEAYDEAMKKFGDFFEVNWDRNTPDIYVVQSRKDVDAIKGIKTEDWVVGWGGTTNNRRAIYVLDLEKFETESDHKRDEEKYKQLIAHELCHLFVSIVAQKTPPPGPMWWNEGICIYLSGQVELRRKPEKFVGFLDSGRENPRPAYGEGGFVIQTLVNKFGKEKLMELIKLLGKDDNEARFKELFEKVYGFELSYDGINKLYIE